MLLEQTIKVHYLPRKAPAVCTLDWLKAAFPKMHHVFHGALKKISYVDFKSHLFHESVKRFTNEMKPTHLSHLLQELSRNTIRA